MLRFSSSDRQNSRDDLSRRQQWRLLLLVVPLGLVVVLWVELRDRQTAERLSRFIAAAGNEEQRGDRAGTGRPRASTDALPPGTFRSRLQADDSVLAEVRPKLLKTITDNSPFRNAEQEAWFHLLAILQRATDQELSEAPQREVDYVQLVDQPHAYRGGVVTVRGQARQVTEQTPAANELGIETYYRVVLQPSGRGDWPIFVYALELPAGLSLGDESGAVSATGFFFKNLSYRWQDGLGIAPVVLAKQMRLDSLDPGAPTKGFHRPTADDAWTADQRGVEEIVSPTVPLREMLALAGWDGERLAQFDDHQPLSDAERREAVQLLRRLRTFDAASWDAWAADAASVDALLVEPDKHRGEAIRLYGHVMKATRHALGPADAERLAMAAYYECELALDEEVGSVTVLTSRAPAAWLEMPSLDEPASATAVYLKPLPAEGNGSSMVFASRDIAWHPAEVRQPFVSLGRSVLGMNGVDVGLLEAVRNHQPILATERDVFYQMLSATGQLGPNQLVRAARRNLEHFSRSWSREVQSASPDRRLLAREVVERAGEGRFSVAPLFNDADHQVGELFVFDGLARRVTRVEVGISPGGGPSDVLSRFGIDHYYELQVFTDDSQNRPLVFCVRELPAGFPSGGDVRVPVRMAGFFFKSWRYLPQEAAASSGGEPRSGGIIAPLLIGRVPIPLERPAEDDGLVALLSGGVVLLTIAGIWAAVWWWGRADRRVRQRRLAMQFSLPPGQSLDELVVPDEDSPPSSPDGAPRPGGPSRL